MYGFRARLCDSEDNEAHLTNYTELVRISDDDFSVVRRKNNVEVSVGTQRGVSVKALRCPGIRVFHKTEFCTLFPKVLPFVCSDDKVVLSHVIISDDTEVYVKIKEPKNMDVFLNSLWTLVVQEKKTLFICIC